MSKLLVQLSHLSIAFGANQLFEDISLSVNEYDRFALIGENGSGKTTLLHLLAEACPSHFTIGFLPQEIVLNHSEMTVRQYIEEGPLSKLERDMALCLENPDRLIEWAELHEHYEKLGGYMRLPAEKVLHGLKLESYLDLSMEALSSGQRVRIALAKALIENPDLLLLDEPTNHLDDETFTWLQEVVRTRRGATIIVSHDRKFLNETCNQLIEIRNGKLSCYGGNYDFYLEEQKILLERQMQAYEKQQKELAELKHKIKGMTFSKAKAAGSTDRNKMAYDRRGEHHQKSIQRTLEMLKARLNDMEAHLIPHPKPKTVTGLRFRPQPLTSMVVVIELEGISKSFDDKILFSNISKTLSRGDRLVIKGPNGSGKTTLLRCIAGIESLDSGFIHCTPSAKIVYLDQEVEMLPLEQTPFEYFNHRFSLTEEEVRRHLHQAGLACADLLNLPFSTMSVGQKKRLMLLSLILEKPNVLLLDEPTNHLDLLTLEVFEQALLSFDGAILAVSHDSTFIEKIATEIWRM